MINFRLSGLIIFSFIALAGCTNSTDELNNYVNELLANEVRVGVTDIFESRDVRRDVDLSVEMSLYDKCESFFSSNPDLALIKDNLVFEQFLFLALGKEDTLLSPFLALKDTSGIEKLGMAGQQLILTTDQDKAIAQEMLDDHWASPLYRESKAFLEYNPDFPKIKPLGVCMAQEMFVTLLGQQTMSTEMLLNLTNKMSSGAVF